MLGRAAAEEACMADGLAVAVQPPRSASSLRGTCAGLRNCRFLRGSVPTESPQLGFPLRRRPQKANGQSGTIRHTAARLL
jgi:hypothetical protein